MNRFELEEALSEILNDFELAEGEDGEIIIHTGLKEVDEELVGLDEGELPIGDDDDEEDEEN
jgi:hypothetical protein